MLQPHPRVERAVEPGHSMLAWIARHAAFLLTRVRIRDDGKSANQRAVAREWRRPTFVFGEQIMFKPAGAVGRKRSSPLEPQVAMGRYIGNANRNTDLFVMTPTRVVKGHSLHRRAEEDHGRIRKYPRTTLENDKFSGKSISKPSRHACAGWRATKL